MMMSLLRLRIVGVVMRTYAEAVPMFLRPLPAAIDLFFLAMMTTLYPQARSIVDRPLPHLCDRQWAALATQQDETPLPLLSSLWSFLVAEVAGPPLNCVALSVALVVWVGPRVALFERL
jgi:hypothetical protein